jgi:pimeloyl-ACP methyl ester carboxylesterase
MGIVFLHGWGGYRIGPHRMFVTAARRLARKGYPALRFDFRGRGDSEGDAGRASIASMISDTAPAIAFLQRETGVCRVALLGICSGCKVAMGAGLSNPAVSALVLWSAQLLGPAGRAEKDIRRRMAVLRDYLRKLVRRETWVKLATFRLRPALIRRAVVGEGGGEAGEREHDRQILDAFRKFGGEALFIYGESDPEAAPGSRIFSSVCASASMKADFRVVRGANHNFDSQEWEGQVLDLTEQWLGGRTCS